MVNVRKNSNLSKGWLYAKIMKHYLNSKNYYELKLIDQKKRDLILVIPGGSYIGTAQREGWIVAQTFSDQMYHQAVFFYREETLLFPNLNIEGRRVLSELKNHPLVNNIYVIGFSAGGHYSAMLSSLYSEYIDKLILCYPVITTDDKYSHQASISNLLGEHINQELLDAVSVEKHIHDKFPPTFVMHTYSDELVPIENSLLLVEALKEHQIYQESHFYPTGVHGLSIVTKEVTFEDMDKDVFIKQYGYIHSWVNLAKYFLMRKIQ